MKLINFTYVDFNTSTRRSTDNRRYASANLHYAPTKGFYVAGALGCGKTRPTVREALKEYLGGRELVQFQVQD